MMNKIAVALLVVATLAVVAGAQKKFKPWTEWSPKEAQKMLDDSPWGQTQVETNTSEMFYSPTAPRGSASRSEQGAFNQATWINYRIRFLSARPIRQAFARAMEAQQPSNSQLSKSLRDFVERSFDEWTVVAVTFESRDGRISGAALQDFNSATAGTLKNKSYLETKGGERLFLEDYKPPSNDGLGAKFIFRRVVEGKPFITAESGEARFYSEVGKSIKLNMRFKVTEMNYDGKLEY
ncbi:MAG: hypothetical protein ACREAM_10675 [Blastocatellia bacterium]